MDRELAQFLAIKFASAVRTDPWKHFERLLSIGLLQLSLGLPCHGSLGVKSDSVLTDATTSLRGLLNELCAGPGEYPNGWFDPSRSLRLCTPGFDCVGNFVTLSWF